jgi:hypothetical protein
MSRSGCSAANQSAANQGAVITEALVVTDSARQRGLDARVPKVVAFPEQRLA